MSALLALACAAPETAATRPEGGKEPTPSPGPVVQQGATDATREAHRRADEATDALVARFWRSDAGAFAKTPGGGETAEYWISAQALDSVLDGVERTGGRRWADVPRAFVAAQEERGWSRDFFDDENWMALALIRAADVTGDASALARAGWLLDDVAQAWDEGCCGARAGGIWWDRAHTQKATASNAGPVITAARLYERTGDERRLAFARKVFAYWFAEMVDPSTGQVADHVTPAGEKVWWRYSYNEGTMIGAALALHHATNEPAYLEAARRIGAFLRDHETAPSADGPILSDGASCSGDCEQFKGIAQRYLAALAEADPDGGWGELVRSNAAAVWDLARDPASTTFGVEWAGPPGAASLSTQSASSTALEMAARAAGPYPG